MFCDECGKKLPDDAKFCVYCGNKITRSKVEKSPKPNYQKTYKAPRKKSKRPVILGVVGVFVVIAVAAAATLPLKPWETKSTEQEQKMTVNAESSTNIVTAKRSEEQKEDNTGAWSDAYRDFVVRGQYLTYDSSLEFFNEKVVPQFGLYDMDKDSVPELIIYNGCHYMADATDYVFIYKNGEIVYIGNVGFRDCGLYYFDKEYSPGLFCSSGNTGIINTVYYGISSGNIYSEEIMVQDGNRPNENGDSNITKKTSNDDLYLLVLTETPQYLEMYELSEIQSMGWDGFLRSYGYNSISERTSNETLEGGLWKCVYETSYYEGEQPYSWTTYTYSYDSEGHLITKETTEHNIYGVATITTDQYDPRWGTITEHYYRSGPADQFVHFEYYKNSFSDEGLWEREEEYDHEFKLYRVIEYEYDTNGRKTKESVYNNHRSTNELALFTWEEWIRDSEGRVIEDIRYAGENNSGYSYGEIIEYTRNEYDSDGTKRTYDKNGELIETGVIYYGLSGDKINTADEKDKEKNPDNEYDENGRITKLVWHDASGNVDSIYTYAYDEAGNQISEAFCYPSGEIITESVRTFDAYGNKIKEVSGYVNEPDVLKTIHEWSYEFYEGAQN